MQETSAPVYRVSAVSYTNSIPFVYGLKNSPVSNKIELSLDIPSQCAQKLIDGKADIGLVPVAVMPQIPNAKIISNYCIGAVGKVNTVMLLSHVPLEQIKQVWLDFQSRTSVALVKVLFRELWKSKPDFLQATAGYEAQIQGDTAGVVIGDRCFELNKKFAYQYDLSEAWKQLTALPFVFACWVANKEIEPDFVKEFNFALEKGLENKQAAITELLNSEIEMDIAENYLNNVISYPFDNLKQEALNLFLEKLKANG